MANLSRRNGGSAIDGRTTRHPGYASSQRIRKRIEESFGWIKTVAGLDRPKLRGVERIGWAFTFAAAAYNCPPAQAIGGGHRMILQDHPPLALANRQPGHLRLPTASKPSSKAAAI